MQVGCSEREIDKLILLQDFFSHSRFLDHAAADRDDQTRIPFPYFFQPCHVAECPAFCVLPYAACVEDYKVRFFPVRRFPDAHFFQHARKLFAVVRVHLASVGHDKKAFRFLRHQPDLLHESLLPVHFLRRHSDCGSVHHVPVLFRVISMSPSFVQP